MLTLVIGAVIAVHAILQKFHLDPLQLGNIDEASGRSYGTLGQPNFLGQWLIFPFFIAIRQLFAFKLRRKKRLWVLMYRLPQNLYPLRQNTGRIV